MRTFSAIFVFLVIGGFFPAGAQRPVDMERLSWARDNATSIRNGMEAMQALIRKADGEMTATVPVVTEKNMVAASGDPHDYVSMGPYWWPDPDKQDGLPYIRRDGERNPELRNLDRVKLDALAGNVNTLAYAYFFTGREDYARKAVDGLRRWFVDPSTRMNPHLDYAQMIPGHNGGKGRSAGLIDTYCFVEMVDCIRLLEDSEAMDAETYATIKKWFSDLADWMLSSKNGIDEMMATNNHSVAYDVQVAAYASFSGRDQVLREIAKRFPAMRLFKQVQPDGSQPRELERTMAMHYTVYNLEHMMDMCLLARRGGIEIYPVSSGDGRSVGKAVAFIAPYIGKAQDEFPYREIGSWEDNRRKLAWTLRRATLFEPDQVYDTLFETYTEAAADDLRWLLQAK